MSRLLITIDKDNASFAGDEWQVEACRVLLNFAVALATTDKPNEGGVLRDSAGLLCGAWDYQPNEPD